MRALTILLSTFVLCFYLAQCNRYDRLSKSETAPEAGIVDSINFDQKKALADLREQIKGWENDPSENVYLNIQAFNGVPAEKLLSVMDMEYTQALGVTCLHCHDSKDWSSDTKSTKNIAREMSKMVDQINNDILANIEALGERTGNVTCNTCHRGEKKPVLELYKN